MKTDYIKQIITMVIGLAAIGIGGGRLMAQTTDTTRTSTYNNGLSKAAKAAKIAPNIKTPGYSALTKNYACVGDTIYIEAEADNIKDLIVPEGKYWSGDAIDLPTHTTPTSITKRFYTYHPYQETTPTAEKSKDFDFIIEQQDGTKTKVTQAIIAKSCPPTTTTTSESKLTDQYNLKDIATGEVYYSLGAADFTYVLQNPSTDPSKVKVEPIIAPQPELALFCWLQTEFSKDASRWQVTYRALPTRTETYDITIVYNEGDSTGRRVKPFAPKIYTRTVDPAFNGRVTAKATEYCSGEDIHFSLTLPENYERMLLQYAKGKALDQIARCFAWRTPNDTPVNLTAWDENTHTYSFTTKASGVSTDYACTMSVRLRHISSARESSSNPRLKVDTVVQYQLDIPPFQFHSAASFKRTPMEAFACQGATINLQDSLSDETKPVVQKIELSTTSPTSGFTTGASFSVPASSTKVYARITTNFSCPLLGNTFIDSIQVNVTPQPKIAQIQGISNGMEICAGTSLNVSAAVTPDKTDVTWLVDGVQVSDKPSAELSLSHDATVTVQASNTCPPSDVQSFAVKVNALPQISMTSLIEQCPGTTVTLSGSGNGSNANYQLRDLKTNQPIAPTGFDATTGLTDYPLAEGDDLELTYTAYNGKCPASATARITAHPLPEVQITYDGQARGDGATLCVPRNEPFTLSASGTDTYAWSKDGTGVTTPDFNLTADAAVTVRGTDKTTTCSKDITVQCVVSVNPVGSTSETICPGEDVRFAADDLPDTKYVWRDQKGNSVGNSHEYHASDLQPGQEGEYKLEITRSTCTWEPLTYQLAFHPYPDLTVMANNPACQGDELVINYLHGLPVSERPTYSLKRADGSEVSGGQLQGDRVIYRMPDIQPAQAGTYTFTIASSHNCTDTDITEIEVDQPVVANMVFEADQTTFCEDETALLTAEALPDGDYTYKWHNDVRTVYEGNEARIPVIWQRTDNGTLYLEIIQRVCRSSAQKDITVIPRPHLSGMPQDTGLCTGMPLCLKPVSDIKPDQITWFFIGENGKVTTLEQGANPNLTYCWARVDALMDGRYFAEAANQGCIGHSDTMSLTVYPLPDIRIEGPDFICDGDTVTLTAVSGTPGANLWSPSGQTTETLSVTKAGRYAVTRISTYGCRDSAETSLEARPLPYFNLPSDTSICRGTSFMIYGPENMDAYLWNDGSEEKDRLADDGGWYILTVFRNECPFSDSLYVHESFCGQFHFPTAFTPNDNRVNDTWGAISAAKDEDMAEYDLMVFDRNGKKVFHGKRISEQWDGKYKGLLCPPGVYTYSFRALEKEEGIKYQSNGTVTIVL